MKKSLYTILISGLLLGALSLFPSKAYAVDCQEIYGGNQSCTSSSFSIEKLVQTPGKSGGNFVDNLSVNDPKYSPSEIVNFRVIVKNTSNQNISKLTVSDKFPQFLSFVSGPGSFDSNSQTLTFTINNLGAGQSQTFSISAKIADTNLLPSDQGVICIINQALGVDSNNMTNSSSSQFCVAKQVLGTSLPVYTTKGGITTTPSTGPEMLPLISLIPGGLAGLILRKKAKTL